MKERLQNKKLEDLKLEKVSGGADDGDKNSQCECPKCHKYTGTMPEVMKHMETCQVDHRYNWIIPDPRPIPNGTGNQEQPYNQGSKG